MKCQKCNAENPEIAKFCHNCGGNLEENITYENKSEELNPEKGNSNTDKIKVISVIVLFVCLISTVLVFAGLISNSAEPSSDSGVEYNAYEEETESFEYSEEEESTEEREEELFIVSDETIQYDGYREYRFERYYDYNGKYEGSVFKYGDDDWETSDSFTYDDYGRIFEIRFAPDSPSDSWTLTLDDYYEDEDGNFVSHGNFDYFNRYTNNVSCKYDNCNRLLEFYIYDEDDNVFMYENRSYYANGMIEYKETKSEAKIEKMFYNEDGSLDKKIISKKSNGPSSEYYYKRYKGLDIQVSAVVVDSISTAEGYEYTTRELRSDVEVTENRIEITNFSEGEVEGYITWEFDENGNKTKMSDYNADYELKSETYYTWIEKSAYFDSYD